MTKIVIRAAESDDAAPFHEIFQQPQVIAGTLQLPYPSKKLWQERLENLDNRYT